MTWEIPQRSEMAQSFYDAAEAERAQHPEKFSLEVDDIVERALALGVDSPDEFVGDWRSGLEQFLGSAREDGRLNAIGARTIGDQVAAKLASGPKNAAALLRHSDRLGRPIIPPIVVVGGWRTGTTFLFRLMGTDPRLHAPLPIELARPDKYARSTPEQRSELLAKLAAAPNPLQILNPTLQSVHDFGPTLAEECVIALGVDIKSWGLPATVRVDSYAEWLRTQGLSTTYDRYVDVLRLLNDGDRRFVLKAPAHTPELANVARVFPGSVIVHLHRDMVETVASGASLFSVFRTTYSDDVDPLDVGRFQTEQTEVWMRRAWEFRNSPAADRVTIVDVAFSELVSDTESVLSRIYAAADMDLPPNLGGFIEAYHQAKPRHEHGQHRYTPEDFGIDRAEIAERFAFVDVDV